MLEDLAEVCIEIYPWYRSMHLSTASALGLQAEGAATEIESSALHLASE